jgi:hypothetical protein
MVTEAELRAALVDFIKRNGIGKSSLLAKVKAVNIGEKTIDLVDDDNAESFYEGVRLNPVVDSTKGLTIFPKIGTWCLAVRIEDSEEWMAVAFGEVQTFSLNAVETIFNDGLNDGLVKLNPLLEKINNLENEVNSLKQILLAWTPVPSDGGAALKTAVSTWAATNMVMTQKSDLENPAIKQ